jgi:hypothetical protein
MYVFVGDTCSLTIHNWEAYCMSFMSFPRPITSWFSTLDVAAFDVIVLRHADSQP